MPLNSVVPDSLVANIAKTENSFAEMVQEGRFEDLGNYFITWGIDFVSKLAIALVLFFVGRWVIRQVKKVIDKVMFRRKVEPTLREFLRNLINIALYVILIVLIVNVVGTQTVSIAAIIGSAGLAIGLSVKDNLANFAGGGDVAFQQTFQDGRFYRGSGYERNGAEHRYSLYDTDYCRQQNHLYPQRAAFDRKHYQLQHATDP